MPPEQIGLQAVFDTRPFDAGLRAYVAGSALAGRVTGQLTRSMNVLGEIATGALRRIGELAINGFVRAGREALRFAQNVLRAAADGSALERSMGDAYASLVNVTRVTFAPLFDQISGLVQRATPAFLGFVKVAESAFAGLASNALTYGSNIVNQLAQGMWNAVSNVVAVLTNIGNMVSYWLSPGSPPRLLPDLDDWGTEAMNIWLGGWKKGDFSLFSDISGTIETLIRSTAAAGGTDTGIVPRIIGSREGIARAVDEMRSAGKVSKGTLDTIIAQVGTADQGVRAYLESMIHLQAANQIVADAQSNLNRVTAEYAALLKPVEDELSAIDEAQQQLAEDQQRSLLQMVIADPNASATSKRDAQLKIDRMEAERRKRALIAEKGAAVDVAQGELDAAERMQAAAADQFEAQRALVALQAEQNALLREQIALLERMNEASAVGGAAAPKAPSGGVMKPTGGFAPDTTAFEGFAAKIQELLAPLLAAWESAWARIRVAMQPAVDAWNNYVVPAWNDLKNALIDSMPAIESAIGEMVAFAVLSMGITLPGVFRNVGEALGSLARIWERHHETILDVLVVTFKIIFTTINVTMLMISGIIAAALRLIEGTFNTWSLALKGDWAGVWLNVKTTLADAWRIIQETIYTALDAILLIVGQDLETFKTNWAGVFELAKLIFVGLATEVGTKAAELVLAITNIWNAARDFWNWLTGKEFKFNISLPDPFTPGSATPFEKGLRGITAAMREATLVANTVLGGGSLMASAAMSSPAAFGGGGASNSYTNNYNYAPIYQGAPASPARDFAILSTFSR